jgi:hypothetical protein
VPRREELAMARIQEEGLRGIPSCSPAPSVCWVLTRSGTPIPNSSASKERDCASTLHSLPAPPDSRLRQKKYERTYLASLLYSNTVHADDVSAGSLERTRYWVSVRMEDTEGKRRGGGALAVGL